MTVEAYPYGTGSMVVGAMFFADPAFPERTGSDYRSLEVVRTGHRFGGRDELMAAQADDPGALVPWRSLDVADAVPWTVDGVT